MRLAVVSDIHGNRAAFEAVLADLRESSPDVILHGGDLADGGSSPVEIVDWIRDLGWQGVAGNADEMLYDPASLETFASQSSAPPGLWSAVREMAASTRAALGQERIEWLRGLPRSHVLAPAALVHASLKSTWHSPVLEASDAEFESVYGSLGQPIVIYGHIHRAFIRRVSGMTIANTGSVSLSFDGDHRAAYLLLDDAKPVIRRVAYDVERELKSLAGSGFPHADWIAKILRSATPQLP